MHPLVRFLVLLMKRVGWFSHGQQLTVHALFVVTALGLQFMFGKLSFRSLRNDTWETLLPSIATGGVFGFMLVIMAARDLNDELIDCKRKEENERPKLYGVDYPPVKKESRFPGRAIGSVFAVLILVAEVMACRSAYPGRIRKALPSSDIPASTSPPRTNPFDLSDQHRYQQFKVLLKPPAHKDTICVGCISWSERACFSAGRFMILLSDAGWEIDQNKVFRVEADVPSDGISTVRRSADGMRGKSITPRPGWVLLDDNTKVIHQAFAQMGITVHNGWEDDLPSGLLGIYFGVQLQ